MAVLFVFVSVSVSGRVFYCLSSRETGILLACAVTGTMCAVVLGDVLFCLRLVFHSAIPCKETRTFDHFRPLP